MVVLSGCSRAVAGDRRDCPGAATGMVTAVAWDIMVGLGKGRQKKKKKKKKKLATTKLACCDRAVRKPGKG